MASIEGDVGRAAGPILEYWLVRSGTCWGGFIGGVRSGERVGEERHIGVMRRVRLRNESVWCWTLGGRGVVLSGGGG